MKPSFGFIFTIDLSMSFVVGAVMSVAMMIYNGQPLEPVPLLVNVVLATVIGLVVLLIIPVIRGGEKFAQFYGSENQRSLAFGLLQSIVIAHGHDILRELRYDGVWHGLRNVSRWNELHRTLARAHRQHLGNCLRCDHPWPSRLHCLGAEGLPRTGSSAKSGVAERDKIGS